MLSRGHVIAGAGEVDSLLQSGTRGEDGVIRDANGRELGYYKGDTEPPPRYLLTADTLIGEEIPWAPGFFYTLPFDKGTKAGFVTVTNPNSGQTWRHYFTVHQPTELANTPVWFRKVFISNTPGGVEIEAWQEVCMESDAAANAVRIDPSGNEMGVISRTVKSIKKGESEA